VSARIAIGIATRGRAAVLRDVLDELRKQTRAPDRIVICHVTADDVTGIAEAHPDVLLLTAPAGLPRQRNAIIDAVGDCDLLLFLDDDFLPAPDYLAVTEAIFAARQDMVVSTGLVIADGAKGVGITVEEGRALLRQDMPPDDPLAVEDAFNGYGCNMAIRLAPTRTAKLRFDEALPLYAWYEDIDFTRRLGEHGTILRLPGARGVHLGSKAGRVPGLRLGYSQVVNPIYLARKGSFPWNHAIPSAMRHCVINLLRSAFPEAHVDRFGRFRGNMIGLFDLLRGRASPGRILEL
jgi:GT2 family glycosyltransferase